MKIGGQGGHTSMSKIGSALFPANFFPCLYLQFEYFTSLCELDSKIKFITANFIVKFLSCCKGTDGQYSVFWEYFLTCMCF